MNKITVCLLRVSTDKQKTESQKAKLVAECEKRGLVSMTLAQYRAVADKVTTDDMVVWCEDIASGKHTKRPEYQWALGSVRQGHVVAVLAYDVSRIGRNLRNNLEFADACIVRDVELFSVTDSVDLASSAGRLKYNLLSAMAEYQREQIGEKVREGMAAAKARGIKMGGSNAMTTTAEIAADMEAFEDMIRRGLSNYRIRKKLKWNLRTIRKYRLRIEQPNITMAEINERVYGIKQKK